MRKPFDKFAKWREAQVAEWHCRVGKITRKIVAKAARKPREAKPAVAAPYVEVDELAHLRPGWVSPAASRAPKQQWANWVRGWSPVSAYGRAAKAYSMAHNAKTHRDYSRIKAMYKSWLAKRDTAQATT